MQSKCVIHEFKKVYLHFNWNKILKIHLSSPGAYSPFIHIKWYVKNFYKTHKIYTVNQFVNLFFLKPRFLKFGLSACMYGCIAFNLVTCIYWMIICSCLWLYILSFWQMGPNVILPLLNEVFANRHNQPEKAGKCQSVTSVIKVRGVKARQS